MSMGPSSDGPMRRFSRAAFRASAGFVPFSMRSRSGSTPRPSLRDRLAAVAVHIKYACVLLEQVARGDARPDLVVPRAAVRERVRHSVSISQGGFNMAYTGGVLHVVRQHPEVFEDSAFLGVSTGAVVACCICVGMTSRDLTEVMKRFNQGFVALGPRGWHQLVGQLGGVLDEVLPDDAHEMCDGRLVVGVASLEVGRPPLRAFARALCAVLLAGGAAGATAAPRDRSAVALALLLACVVAAIDLARGAVRKVPTYRSRFADRADLIRALQCSCSIPFVQDGLLRRESARDGTWLVDGGFAMRHAVLEGAAGDTRTITVDKDREHAPQADVVPPVLLPPRVVTPPSTWTMYQLFEMGADNFHDHLSDVLGLVPQRRGSTRWRRNLIER